MYVSPFDSFICCIKRFLICGTFLRCMCVCVCEWHDQTEISMDFSRVLNSMKNRDSLWCLFSSSCFFSFCFVFLLHSHAIAVETFEYTWGDTNYRKPICVHKSSLFVLLRMAENNILHCRRRRRRHNRRCSLLSGPIFPIQKHRVLCNYAFRCIIVCHIWFFVLCTSALSVRCKWSYALNWKRFWTTFYLSLPLLVLFSFFYTSIV